MLYSQPKVNLGRVSLKRLLVANQHKTRISGTKRIRVTNASAAYLFDNEKDEMLRHSL